MVGGGPVGIGTCGVAARARAALGAQGLSAQHSATSLTEQVKVEVAEVDGVDRVTILGEAS